MRLWTSRLLGTTANQMLLVSLGWQMHDLTHSAWDLGLVGLFQFLPALAPGFVAGQVVDRYHRARIVALCMAAQAVNAAALVWASMAHGVGREMLLVVSVAVGTVRAFQMPTQQALTPMVLPPASCHAVSPSAPPARRAPSSPGQPSAASPTSPALAVSTRSARCCSALPGCSSQACATSSRRASRRRSRWRRCSPACASCATARPCSARSRSISSPCSSEAPSRCCRSSRATCCRSARGDSDCCAPRPPPARC